MLSEMGGSKVATILGYKINKRKINVCDRSSAASTQIVIEMTLPAFQITGCCPR